MILNRNSGRLIFLIGVEQVPVVAVKIDQRFAIADRDGFDLTDEDRVIPAVVCVP